MTPFPLRDAGPRRRLRRRARDLGLEALDDRDLLALLLMRSAPRADVARLAGGLMDRFGGLAPLVAADETEVRRTAPLGGAALLDLKLIRELTVRLARADAEQRPVISSWSALLAYARVALAHEAREQFRVLFLDRRNRLIRDELVAHGSVDHAPVYPREVVRRALEVSASALVLVHNHPSGDPTPSPADVEMTRQVVAAARSLGIEVHDHLVVGKPGVASFKTLGLL